MRTVVDLFGPFLINGRAVSTGLTPQPGDRVSILTSGVLTALLPGAPGLDSVTADGLVNAANTPQPAPSGWPNAGLTQLSLVGRVGSQSIQLGTGLKELPNDQQSLPVGGELSLDVNAPPPTQYDDGWSVYIVRAAANEQMPHLRDWVFFEDLTTGPTDVSGGVAAAVLGNVIHVFWINAGTPYGVLNHLTNRSEWRDRPDDDRRHTGGRLLGGVGRRSQGRGERLLMRQPEAAVRDASAAASGA